MSRISIVPRNPWLGPNSLLHAPPGPYASSNRPRASSLTTNSSTISIILAVATLREGCLTPVMLVLLSPHSPEPNQRTADRDYGSWHKIRPCHVKYQGIPCHKR